MALDKNFFINGFTNLYQHRVTGSKLEHVSIYLAASSIVSRRIITQDPSLSPSLYTKLFAEFCVSHLVTLAKIRKGVISFAKDVSPSVRPFCLSICPSFYMRQIYSRWMDFREM